MLCFLVVDNLAFKSIFKFCIVWARLLSFAKFIGSSSSIELPALYLVVRAFAVTVRHFLLAEKKRSVVE